MRSRPRCKHTRVVYRDRLNVALLRREDAFRAECRACGVPVPMGTANDTSSDPRVADMMIVEQKLAAILAEALHEETDPEMAQYHWAAVIDIALDDLLRRDAARSRPRSPIERLVDAACGIA